MRSTIRKLVVALLCVAYPLSGLFAQTSSPKRTLTVMLYASIPAPGGNYNAMAARIKKEFEATHHDIDLSVIIDPNVDIYDCPTLQQQYSPKGPNVLELDTVMLGYAQSQKWVAPFPFTSGSYAPQAVHAATVGKTTYAVPTYYGGTNWLVTRTAEIAKETTAAHLVAALKKHDTGKYPMLVGNLNGTWVLPSTYSAAYVDIFGLNNIKNSFKVPLNPTVVASMTSVLATCTFMNQNNCTNGTYSSNPSTASYAFAQKQALAVTGYPEILFDIETKIKETQGSCNKETFYIHNTPLGNKNQASLWVNGLTINASNCRGQCAADAKAFAEYYTSNATTTWVALSKDVPTACPRYLISTRPSFLNVPEIKANPHYRQFGVILAKSYSIPNKPMPQARVALFPAVCQAVKNSITDTKCTSQATWCKP